MDNEQKKIFLIDANNIIYRSFFAIGRFTTSTGQPTNAVFGFVSTLLKILKEYKPVHMAVVFDAPGPTFRHSLFEEYKIARKPMPDELQAQIPVIKEIIKRFGMKILQQDGYEADDLLASVALKFSERGFDIVVITGDKDILQLLNRKITVLNPATWKVTDENIFQEKYGFAPASIVDYLALAGDASDSIPGVRGIGEKTAAQLVRKFGSIENIYENIADIKGRTRDILMADKNSAFLSKKLVLLSCNIPLEITEEHLKISQPNILAIKEIFQNLEFRKFENSISEIFSLSSSNNNHDSFAIGESIFDFREITENPQKFKQKLEDKNILKIGKDIKEKTKLLASKNIHLSQPYFDVSIASFLLGKSISAADILQAYRQYREELTKQQMEFLFDCVEIPLIEVIVSMETNGILVDTGYLKELKDQYQEEMDQLQEKIFALVGEVFNINSPSQVGRILFERLGLPSKRKTKTGYSTNTNVLEQIRDRHKIVDLILQYRELSKLCSTYIDGFSEYISPVDSRIHPEFLQTGVSSGRLACRNPNLQAIPVKTEKGGRIRKIFIAAREAVLYSFDYNQIELRVLAHFSDDPVLCDAFKNGRDIHLETAKQLFPFQSDSLFGSEDVERYRRIAKTINFGIIYGMNAYGLAQRLSCTPEEGQAFIESYFAKFQGVRRYIHRSISDAEKLGYARTMFGRKRYLPEIHSENKNQREFACRVAINMPIQGTSAELIKLAMIEIHKLMKSRNLQSKMILQIHDELLFEIYEEEQDVVEEIRTIMENIYNLNVPLKVDVQKGKNYLELTKI